jgi:NodT family efflux transporter outer membrane factor (OMF) lipoprotein
MTTSPETAGVKALKPATRPALLAMAVALALSACASTGGVSPLSAMRKMDSITAQASLERGARLTAAWPNEQWWQRYGDAQLDRLLAEAFSGSPTLRIAEARVRQAGAAMALVESTSAPQLNGKVKSTRQQYSGNSIVPKQLAGNWAWYNEASVNFGYELDFWGKNRASIEAAIGRVKAGEANAQATRLMLSVAITQAYMALEHAFRQLDLAESVLKTRLGIEAIAKQRVAAQLDSAVELKQAELAVPVAREQIAQVNEAIALLRIQLAALAGQGPDRGLAIKRPQVNVSAPQGVPASLSADLVGRRPDVVAQRWRVEALTQDIAVAKAQFYPNVNLIAFLGFQSLGFASLLEAGSRIAGAGPAISLPIFDGGRLRASLALRSAEYDAAVEQYNQTLIDAIRDVVSQATSLQWLQERRQQQAQALQLARETYQLALQRYRSGLGTYLQVLVIEGQLLAQQRARNDLDARALELDVNLVRALGGGYQSAAPAGLASLSSAHSSPVQHEQAY